jgi:hypothetical protein
MKVNRFQRRIITAAFAVALLAIPGCRKKKPNLPPPQAQAPTTTAQPAPPTIAPETAPNSTATQPPLPEASTTIPKPLPPKPKGKHHNGVINAKKQQPSPKPTTPAQTATASSPNNEEVGQISPDVPSAKENSTVQSTNQLLDSTEQNLRSITRGLNNDEQNTLAQIRSYVAQSRAALKDQDFERAHNLAIKAHLLTDGLVRQ